MSEVTIPLPWPRPPATSNQRGNWRADAARRKTALEQARWAIRGQQIAPIEGIVEVTIHWRIPNAVTRDADGLALTGKCVLDAVVQEGVLPGDSWRTVRATTCRIHPPERGEPAAMWLTIERVQ